MIPLRPFSIVFFCMALASESIATENVDLGRAVIVVREKNRVVQTAARVLAEEIARRTGVELAQVTTRDDPNRPAVLLCRVDRAPYELRTSASLTTVPDRAEGFAITVHTDSEAPLVVLAGRDERGVLFAAGRLLLRLRMGKGRLELPTLDPIATAPRYAHRGHQIAYRSLAHCYDAWTPDTYEQYMRELAVFGANAFETTSFGNPAGRAHPHGKVTYGEMASAWSRICDDYGFDFWLFSHAVGGTGDSPEVVRAAMRSQLETLRAIPHLDHLYLTGGDGGSAHRRPDLMLKWTSRLALAAREIHPGLGIWVSNQGFAPELNYRFFDHLNDEQPEWLTGVVYGAWSRVLLDEQRARLPSQYPIRRYPDIGHCVRGQYPVAGWDRAFARTLGREPFAPRPKGHARIHDLFDEYSDGFVTYSDGIGDDLNKFVWTALGWDPDRDVVKIVLDYARFFFGCDVAETVRDGLFLLEENFKGSLAENDGVEKTFHLWRELEARADTTLLANWRFQACLLRAYYDHYTRLRLLNATRAEALACAALRTAPQVGVDPAIARARHLLATPDQDATTDKLKARILELGDELFRSIGAQLDVAKYRAAGPERGAVLDFLDTPLNNRLWLEDELDAILTDRFTGSMPETTREGDLRLRRLARVADWEDPGPGGFYDDLGCAWKQPHLVKPKPLRDDPAGVTTPREDHTLQDDGPYRLSWLDVSEALYATPLVLRYEGLDPHASYRVRVTYLGRYNATVRLVASGKYEIHGAYGHTLDGVRYQGGYHDPAAVVRSQDGAPPAVVTPLEFVIPREAVRDGTLELEWQRFTGRGVQVAEVWLLRR